MSAVVQNVRIIDRVDDRGLLYIGSATARWLVESRRIRAVVCLVTRDEYGQKPHFSDRPWRVFNTGTYIVHEYHFDMADAHDQDLAPIIKHALPVIAHHHARGEAVLVHCMAGISRSASVVLAHMMQQQTGLTLRDALWTLRERRPIVAPNASFMKQLKMLEEEGEKQLMPG